VEPFRFTELLNLRFGLPLRANPLGDLAACRRIGTVADYCEQFLSLLARAGKLSQSQQVQLFTVGLQPPLSIDVQIQAPQSLDVAMSLAKSYEPREQTVAALPRSSRSSTRSALLPAPATPLPLPAPPSTQGTTTTTTGVAPTTQVTARTVHRLSPGEMEERRCLG
jgi:cell division septation protein DedD